MDSPHTLLQRQLRRHSTLTDHPSPDLDAFLKAVDAAYRESDIDRGMLERSLELSSHELMQANSGLRSNQEVLEQRVAERTAELSQTNANLTKEIAERKRFEAELLRFANYDSLTEIFNRRRFEEELDLALEHSRDHESRGAVLFMNLDQFKDVNDTLGHAAGDGLLREVTGLLRACLNSDTVLARLGGDEFGILLKDVTPSQARHLALKIEADLKDHLFSLDNHPVNITSSIGIALLPRHGSTTQDLLANADLAMYQAKFNGRSRVEMFRNDRSWRSASESRLRWRNRIIEALKLDQFVLYAQPMRALGPSFVDEYELLLRLPTATGHVVRPGAFMNVAEEFSLIQDIDRWVVRKAISILAQPSVEARGMRFSINLSGRSFGDHELLSIIRGELATSGIDPSRLVTEVTETAAITNLGQAQKFISALSHMGLRLSLDDFGVGFSSFSHLKHLPVDYLKIDGSFIKDLPRSETDQKLVKAIVDVAKALGEQTIAEFVGDQETVDILRSQGVDYAQGYFIGRPRPVNRVIGESIVLKAA